jgi:hypothetical protein
MISFFISAYLWFVAQDRDQAIFTAIWIPAIFGFGIYFAVQVPGLGHLVGAEPLLLLDAVYASATTYSTLGYGDLVPRGALRFLFGTEALVGFLMITWSASFAYLEMQRFWRT